MTRLGRGKGKKEGGKKRMRIGVILLSVCAIFNSSNLIWALDGEACRAKCVRMEIRALRRHYDGLGTESKCGLDEFKD